MPTLLTLLPGGAQVFMHRAFKAAASMGQP